MQILEAASPDFDLDKVLDDVEPGQSFFIAREGRIIAVIAPPNKLPNKLPNKNKRKRVPDKTRSGK